jgi:ribonuclease VapC
MIVVDSSSLIAIAAREADWRDHLGALRSAGSVAVSAMNYVETGLLLVGRDHLTDLDEFDRWLAALRVRVEEGVPHSAAALAAYLSFGKGRHPARLNLADCFAYALAKTLDVPLLYKGDNFAHTDIRPALQPT